MTEVDTSIYQTPPVKSGVDQLNDMVGMQTNMQNLQQKKLDMAVGQQNYISNILSSLYGKPDLSANDIIQEGSKAVQMGIIPQQQLGTMLQNLPQDPQALRQYVGSLALRTASAAEKLQAHAGQFMLTDTGSGITGFNRNPMTGEVNPAQGDSAYMRKTPTINEAQARVEGAPDVQGRPTMRPAIGAAIEAGTMNPDGTVNVPPPPGYGSNRLVAPPVATQPPNRLNVTLPAPTRPLPPQINPNISIQRDPGPQAPAPTRPYGDLSNTVSASQPIAMPQGSNTVAEGSAGQFVALQKAAEGARDRKALMQDMEKHLGGFTAGIVGDKLAPLGNAANGIANAFGKPDVFAGVASKEQFDKLSATLQQQRAALGVSSDAGLSNAGASTPNSRYTTAGLEGMLANLKGNEDAIQIKNQEASKWLATHGPNSYGQFQQQFNQTFEPRVFQLPYMKPEAAKKMLSSLSPAEAAKVDQAYKTAVANGWIKRIGGN